MRTGNWTKWSRLVWVSALAVGSTGGCKCGREGAAGSGDSLTTPPIVVSDPDAPAPKVDFPTRWRARDASLNTFIESVLRIAGDGDYEGFRQLFGSEYAPPSRQEFQRVWRALQTISVLGLYGDQPKPEKYFLHVGVERRDADRKGQVRLDRVVMILQEQGRWRLGPVPREIRDVILAASSQPEGGPVVADEPSPSQ